MRRRELLGLALGAGALSAIGTAGHSRADPGAAPLTRRPAHPLDDARLQALIDFVRTSGETLGVPGIAFGVVAGGETRFAGGFGVRERGRPEPVDADTLFLIASNTKPLTTLMLARLVDQGAMGWETPVTDLLPGFSMADADLTRQFQVRHLLCACTGLPYRNIDWEFAGAGADASVALQVLPKMRPTGAFGSTYSYTNPIAAAGGLLGGHVAFPDQELGAAYDAAMQAHVFTPLGMTRTTFDFDRAVQGNSARTYGVTPLGDLAPVDPRRERQMHLIRPAGGAWSNINDLLAYVRMELARGLLPDSTRYISEAALTERWKPLVVSAPGINYGMGLETDTRHGVPVMFHGGRFYGFRGDTIWLPEHDVGVVILMNASTGTVLTDALRQKLVELLFDAEPRAENMVAMAAATDVQRREATRLTLSYPVPSQHAALLASHYRHEFLGEVKVIRTGEDVVFDFGAWRAPVASRTVADGAVAFTVVTASPPPPFTAGALDGRRTLTLNEARSAYRFDEVAG